MKDFVVAIGLMAVIEGLAYAAAPSLVRRAYRQMQLLPDAVLRVGGLAAMAAGVVIVWLVRR